MSACLRAVRIACMCQLLPGVCACPTANRAGWSAAGAALCAPRVGTMATGTAGGQQRQEQPASHSQLWPRRGRADAGMGLCRRCNPASAAGASTAAMMSGAPRLRHCHTCIACPIPSIYSHSPLSWLVHLYYTGMGGPTSKKLESRGGIWGGGRKQQESEQEEG